ncbi:MAG: FHA domain-containing serine/threonine-protein kinase [Planctomycetota bacterium]
MPLLFAEKGPEKGKTYPLPEEGSVVLGRDPSAAVRLSDRFSSRKHCVLNVHPGGIFLHDQGSRNKTLVNGRAATAVRLDPGDRIEIGETVLVLQDDDPAGDPLVAKVVAQNFRVDSRLGRGTSGLVYKVRQMSMERDVALKILHPALARDAAHVEIFRNDAKMAAQLNHPHIVAVHDFGSEGDLHYFAMEFMPGGSLRNLFCDGTGLPVPKLLVMLRHVLLGLEFAESKSVLHGNLKPSNLLVGEGDTVKIGDLGIGGAFRKQLRDTPPDPWTAPEVARGEPTAPRSDLFSLGTIFLKLLPENPKASDPQGPHPDPLRSLLRRFVIPEQNRRPKGAAAALKDLAALQRWYDRKPAAPRKSAWLKYLRP